MKIYQRGNNSMAVISATELQRQIAKKTISLRKDKKMSQSDMAKKFSISQTAYAKIENGKTDITISKMFTICEIFDITLTELIGLDNVISTAAHNEISQLKTEGIKKDNTIKEKDMVINLLRDKLISNGIAV